MSLRQRRGSVSSLVENRVAASASAIWAVTPDFAVVRTRAESVFLGGLLDTNGARVVRDLRRRLDGKQTDLLAPDGFTPVPLLVEHAGAAARDLYVTAGGLVVDRLTPAGARFDGTRSSVVDELFRTRVSDGILGPLRFDPRGDVVTVLRVRGGGRSRTVGSTEGAVVERLVRPALRLVARP